MATATATAPHVARTRSPRARWATRVGWTVVLVILAAWLTWLLARPFLHPRTHLVLLSGNPISVDTAPGAIPADFVVDDFRELLALETILHRGFVTSPKPLVLGSLAQPAEMEQLADRLNRQITGRGDVLLVYVSAHGIVQDGEAWLVAAGADRHAPLGGRYRLSSLLLQLRECTAATKLLLLDAGRLDYDPGRGLLSNDFAARLATAVSQLQDPDLWVLVSHDSGQRSHLSPALRRSVFGYFIAEGMAGAADANGDQSIDLGELETFVQANVANWVRQSTGGSAAQTPRLLWGGGDAAAKRLPVLAAVRPRADDSEEDAAQGIDFAAAVQKARTQSQFGDEATSQARSEVNSLIAEGLYRSTPSGRLGQYVGDAARQVISRATGGSLFSGSDAAAEQPVAPGGAALPAGEPPATQDATASAAATGAATASSPAANEPATPAAPSSAQSKSAAEAKADAQAKSEPAKSESAAETAAASAAEATKKAESDAAGDLAAGVPVSDSLDTQQLEAMLHQAWQLRDELVAADRTRSRPVDDAPHLWRELEQRLLVLDRHVRTGFVRRTSDVAVPLGDVLQQLQWLAADMPASSMPRGTLARAIADARPGASLAGAAARSLGLAERIDELGGIRMPQELAALAAQLDRVIAAGNRSDLEALAAQLTAEHDRWIELRLVRRLAARSDLDWRLSHLLLDVTRSGERAAAASLSAAGWVRNQVESADQWRFGAERQILSSARYDREALIGQLMQARDLYRAAASDLVTIVAARRLANDLWHYLPQYLAWSAASRESASVGPSHEELMRLIDELRVLADLLDRPVEGGAAKVRTAAQQLATARQAVDRHHGATALDQLLTAPVDAGDTWRIELLLETSFPTAEVRAALALAWSEADAALAAQLQSPEDSSTAPQPPSMPRANLADLQKALWASALSDNQPREGDLSDSWRALHRSAEAARDGSLSDVGTGWDAVVAAVEGLARALPAEIARGVAQEQDLSSPASRDARRARLRSWDRAIRLVDPRWAESVRAVAPAALLSAADGYDLLFWHGERALRAGEDIGPSESSYLKSVAEDYRRAAASVPRQPALAAQTLPPVSISGIEQAALLAEAQRHLTLNIENRGASPQRIWLAAEWDAELLSVSAIAPRSVHRWNDLVPGADDFATIAAVLKQKRPSLELAPGEARAVVLDVKRLRASSHPTYVVLRAVTEEHVVRHDVTVELLLPQAVELAIASPPSMWSSSPDGIALYPLPNRITPFALKLTAAQRARRVDVELYAAVEPPTGTLAGMSGLALPLAEAQRLRASLPLGSLVAEARGVALPASGEAVVPILVPPSAAASGPAAASPAGGPANGQAAANADPAATASAAQGASPPMTSLHAGLFAVITDLDEQQQMFHRLTIQPQHPQRWVRAHVRYRAARERIEITIRPQDPALVPAGGVRILGEILEPLPASAERQLAAVLQPGQAEAHMHVEVAAVAGRVVTLALTIDDYPRAMYFRVPCSGETASVPEDMDRLAVRITELPKGTIYRPPVEFIPVQLELDAPGAMLANPPLRLEVGIDRNRDRELNGDEFIVLTTDRQVTAGLSGLSKTGELLVATSVRDFTVELPAGALASGRVNVLARAALLEQEAWSQPVEIVLDDRPPRVSSIEMLPDRVVVIGEELVVSALADDGGLSGVAQLEAIFDLDRSGQFGPMAKPALGALRDDGRWAAKLATGSLAGGNYQVLVRAIDRAGNASSPARAGVRLMTQEEADADAKRQSAADITGVVMYGSQPQAGIDVLLSVDTGMPPAAGKSADDASPPLARAKTDAQGQFRFRAIPAGKYVITAEGLVRNKNRRATQGVEFKSPRELKPVTLKLP